MNNFSVVLFGPVLPFFRQQADASCSCYTERKRTKSEVGGSDISRWESWGGSDTVKVWQWSLFPLCTWQFVSLCTKTHHVLLLPSQSDACKILLVILLLLYSKYRVKCSIIMPYSRKDAFFYNSCCIWLQSLCNKKLKSQRNIFHLCARLFVGLCTKTRHLLK
jgi:hypothetical protein